MMSLLPSTGQSLINVKVNSMTEIITAQEAAAESLRYRKHFESMATDIADGYIRRATERGEQTCVFQIASLGMPELCAKKLEGILTKAGYKASHKVVAGVITMVVSWLPSIEDFELLAALPKGK